MEFIKQFADKRRIQQIEKKPSLTVPEQVIPLKKIISRMQNGNMFGLNMFNVMYESDLSKDFDENAPVVDIDVSDPINSVHELKMYKKEFDKRIKELVKAQKNKVDNEPVT